MSFTDQRIAPKPLDPDALSDETIRQQAVARGIRDQYLSQGDPRVMPPRTDGYYLEFDDYEYGAWAGPYGFPDASTSFSEV